MFWRRTALGEDEDGCGVVASARLRGSVWGKGERDGVQMSVLARLEILFLLWEVHVTVAVDFF